MWMLGHLLGGTCTYAFVVTWEIVSVSTVDLVYWVPPTGSSASSSSDGNGFRFRDPPLFTSDVSSRSADCLSLDGPAGTSTVTVACSTSVLPVAAEGGFFLGVHGSSQVASYVLPSSA